MARRVKRYARQVDEAIFTLLGAGVPDVEIRRMLRDDEAGLGYPCPMPDRTYFDHKRKLLDSRGKPALRAEPGRELDLIEELSRRTLNLISKEIQRLEDKAEQNGGLTRSETSQLKSAHRFVAEAKRAERAEANRSTRGQNGTQARAKMEKTPNAMLNRLSMSPEAADKVERRIERYKAEASERIADEKQDEYEAQHNFATRERSDRPALAHA